jgi:6-phosphogluconolactonase (cycloisomerase 2 family)
LQYTGGQVTFYPTNSDGSLKPESASPPLEFDFPYKKGSAPNNERQDKPHAHHVIEDSQGRIYVCDLGSDRVWVVERDGEELKVKGWLQAPEGSGPRHAALSPDGECLLNQIGGLFPEVAGGTARESCDLGRVGAQELSSPPRVG